jgi:transposase
LEKTITITQQEYTRLLQLELVVVSLQEELRLLKNGKNSKTSSTPPSADIGRSNAKSLRPLSDKKIGGQLGHDGSTLRMCATPNKQEHYPVEHCHNCGTDLLNTTGIATEKRQEIVIPPIISQCVEHIVYQKKCPCCQHTSRSNFPAHLKSPIQYGSSVSSFVAYLSSYQYLPMQRIATLMQCTYGINMSVGTVKNMLSLMALKALPTYKAIQQELQESSVVGSDETGSKIAGKRGWFFTWQNKNATFITASLSRGYKTIETYFAEGFSNAVYVSDCLATQLKVTAKQHQLCVVHLLRELNNFEDALQCTWSTTLKKLLQQSIELKKQLTTTDYITKSTAVIELSNKIYQHLQTPVTITHPKLNAFVERLKKHQNSLLTFLHYEEVPPDNNGSERAIRNIKVKTKVSTQFRTIDGAQEFAILRSVADTAIKNGESPFDVFKIIAEG